MNEWEIAATVLVWALVVCVLVVILSGAETGLVAVEIASLLTTSILMVLSEGFRRQPFIDLAVVFAAVSTVGALTFVRMMEREL